MVVRAADWIYAAELMFLVSQVGNLYGEKVDPPIHFDRCNVFSWLFNSVGYTIYGGSFSWHLCLGAIGVWFMCHLPIGLMRPVYF